MSLASNIRRISCVYATFPSYHTVSNVFISTRAWMVFNFFSSDIFFKLMVPKLKSITKHNHCYSKSTQSIDAFNREFKTRNQENTMRQNEREDLCVHHRVNVPIIMSWCVLKRMLEVSRALEVGFLKTQHLEKQNIKNNRSHKIGIKAISETKPFGCKEGSYNRQKTHSHPNPKPSTIFNVDHLRGFPALFVTSVTLLKSIQKLFSLKTLEFTCLSLQKHGAFLLGKEAKSFAFLSSFEAIPHLTHRIWGKP